MTVWVLGWFCFTSNNSSIIYYMGLQEATVGYLLGRSKSKEEVNLRKESRYTALAGQYYLPQPKTYRA